MNQTDQSEYPLPWYRQFWPWFLIVLVTTAVLASLVTVYIAVMVAPELVGPTVTSMAPAAAGCASQTDESG